MAKIIWVETVEEALHLAKIRQWERDDYEVAFNFLVNFLEGAIKEAKEAEEVDAAKRRGIYHR